MTARSFRKERERILLQFHLTLFLHEVLAQKVIETAIVHGAHIHLLEQRQLNFKAFGKGRLALHKVIGGNYTK